MTQINDGLTTASGKINTNTNRLSPQIHPLHRVVYLPRVTAYLFVVLLIPMWLPMPWSFRIWVVSAFLATWPHLLWFVGRKLFPSLRGAQSVIVSDAIIFCLLWPMLNWSIGPLHIVMMALFINSAGCGGIQLVVKTAIAILATMLLIFGLVGFPNAWNVPPANVIAAQLFFTSIYCGFVGLAAYTTGARLTRSRAQLRDLTEQLEQRVAERTAELRSANEAFMRFVPAEFLHTLGYADITKARLGDATARTVTVLFSDVRDFTKFSEQMTPEETFGFLNACLSRVGPHVRVHGGFIDKYIGDAIMALFPSDPAQAIRAGIAMHQEVRAYNAQHPLQPAMAIGIGVHTGRVMMGTIGEEQRFEATVISDAVNLTARLETLTKQLGATILVSQDVAKHLTAKEQDNTRWLGSFVVKGRATPVELIEVFTADDDALRIHKAATRERFRAAIDAYRNNELQLATDEFSALASLDGADGPARWWHRFVMSSRADSSSSRSRDAVYLDEK